MSSARQASHRGSQPPDMAIGWEACCTTKRARTYLPGMERIRRLDGPVRRRTNAAEELRNVTIRKIFFLCICMASALHDMHAAPAGPAQEFVRTYCLTCHNNRLKTGNLSLETADADQVSNSAQTWEKVVVKLRSRSMPPAGNRRPDNAAYDAVATWLETELDRAAPTHLNPRRPAELHRLNRTEYANAIRDLLDIEIDAAAMLPPDQQAHGFDTNADALLIAPALLDRYLNAAAWIARLAVGDAAIPPPFDRYTAVKGK